MENDEDHIFEDTFKEEEKKVAKQQKLKYFAGIFLLIMVMGLIAFFAFFFKDSFRSSSADCTPYYPEKGCICKTKTLSCEDFDDMYNAISGKIDTLRPKPEDVEKYPSAAYQVGKLVAGMLRLAFHDAAEYDPKSGDNLRSDGCLNLKDGGNGGLSKIITIVDELWIPFCGKISRADFWYLCAKVALESSTPYTDHYNKLGTNNFKRGHDSNEVPNFNIPFFYGRIDNTDCSYSGESRLPNAQGNAREIQRVFMQNLGLDTKSVVALMGGHSLGSMRSMESGYEGPWQSRIDLFDTEFFQNLVLSKWSPQLLVDPNGKYVNQWSKSQDNGMNPNTVMLNTDMEMIYDVQPDNFTALPASCGPSDGSSSDVCKRTNDTYSDLDFPYWTFQFAEGNSTTNDQPGASKWLSVFARAFNQMCSAGYKAVDLTCAPCQTPSCNSTCTRQELCEGPQYGLYPTKK